MLDRDLAELYGVEVKQLKRQVKRNQDRFPADFMFELSREEYNALRSQFGTLKRGEHSKYLPYAFTEQGVSMLSSVLRSTRAVQVNIEIMRAFVRLRELMATHKDLVRRLNDMEKKYDAQFKVVFDAIRELMTPPEPRKRKIGFLVKERAARYGRG
jgi:ORF6N domain